MNPAGQNDFDAWDTLHCTHVFNSSEHYITVFWEMTLCSCLPEDCAVNVMRTTNHAHSIFVPDW